MERVDELEETVAILLSTYNGKDFIEKLLVSIYQQTYKNIAVIIRDDGSSDNTLDIIHHWKSKIKIELINSKKNLGAAESFWELVKYASGYDYYAFCDQDDVWDKDKIETAVRTLERYHRPMLYFCNSRLIDDKDNVVKSIAYSSAPLLTFESEIVCGFCSGCSMVFNSMLMEVMKEQRYSHIPMHDTVTALNALALGGVVYDGLPHFSRRIHKGNVVAKSGKNKIAKLRQSFQEWFINSKKAPMNIFLKEFRHYISSFDDLAYDEGELECLINYKKIKNKKEILCSKKYLTKNKRALRSFRIRLILNLL